MISMEFNDLKKVWDAKRNEIVYGINEEGLRNRIRAHQQKTLSLASGTESFVVLTYLVSGIYMATEFFRGGASFLMPLSAWLLLSGAYFLWGMIRRRQNNNRFDRSIAGDLANAVSNATYQVRLSQSVRINTVPVVALILYGIWQEGRPLWFYAAVLVFFGIVIYVSGIEHNFYRRRKSYLELLQKALEEEV